MNQKFSNTALALFNSEKSKWAELQYISTLDQLLAATEEVKKLKEQLDEANKRIDQLVNETVGDNGN